MAAIALALGSSVLWGFADFYGGSLTRRLHVVAVTVLSQAAGLAGLVLVLVFAGGGLTQRALGLGVLAGLGGGLGLAAFYQALALGRMSIVSPIAACGAVLPVLLALATGERPSALALAGIALALGGAVLASAEERSSGSEHRRRAVLLALLTAVAFGFFFLFLDRAGEGGETLSALLGARIGSLSLLAGLALATRASFRITPRSLAAVAAVGLADLAANGLFVLASQRGLLSVVAVLGSLYPITTVILAYALLGERLTGLQRTGVGVALAGVALASAG